MQTKIFALVMLSIMASSMHYAQSVSHPWYVVDRGGGKSTSAGISLQSSIGQPAAQAGSSGGINLEAGYIPGVRELAGTTTTLDFLTEDTWNMVSVPLIVGDFRKTSLYPTGISSAFTYTGSYQVRDTLKNGVGYWIKFPEQKTVEFTGTSLAKETLDVNNAWNMIGCISYPVRISNIVPIAPTTIASNYFGYTESPGYFTEDTLKPGLAYWIKVNNAGQLVMSSGSVLIPPSASSSIVMKSHNNGTRQPDALQHMSTLTIRDASNRERTLYFSSRQVRTGFDLSKYELPPPPPAFDVRYGGNRIVEVAVEGRAKEVIIRISSAEYPLDISWKSQDEASLLIGKDATTLRGEGSVQIKDEESSIKLRLSTAQGEELPKQFALNQNYPNPFNPRTVIRYQLPVNSYVLLQVYDLLGQVVMTLVNELQDAGYKSVEWDASGSPSGVYFYRLNAGTFNDVKKTTVVK